MRLSGNDCAPPPPRPRRKLSCVFAFVLSVAAVRAQDNVLVFVADDLGIDGVGAYGVAPTPPPTPNLDALARSGVLFENAWASPLCTPSRALLQTGRHAFRTDVGGVIGVANPGLPLRLEETTLPELLDLRGSGYRHAMIGKWHLSDETTGGALGPNAAGWSHFAGILTSVNGDYFDWPRTVNGTTAQSTVYHTTQTVEDALAWIGSVSEPWVCVVAFQAPHHPYHAPPQALHSFNLEGLDPDRNRRPFHKAMVEAMDTEIGRMLRALGPQRDRTNVVFCSDNGTPKGIPEPPFSASQAKGTAYEGGLRVPCIVSGPAVVGAGRRVPALVGLVDVFATIADLCGVDGSVPFARSDSISMVPYLRDPAQAPLRPYLFAELFNGPAAGSGALLAIRDARYKLIRRTWGPPDELYDLENDPFEQTELLGSGPGTGAQQAYARLTAALAALRMVTPQPVITAYGQTGCLGSAGEPQIGLASGAPFPGSSYDIEVVGAAPEQPAFLTFGASDRAWAGLSLPFPLEPVGAGPQCFLQASVDVLLPAVTDGRGRAVVLVPLPPMRTLVAAPLFHTWLLIDPDAPNNPAGLVTTRGLRVEVGG